MHVIIATLGSLGDVLPVLGFGRALREKGHSVAIITAGSFESEVKEAGLKYIEICDRETYERTRSAGEQMFAQSKGFESLEPWIHDLYMSIPERLYRLIEEHQIPGETVAITLPLFSCGAVRLAERKLGVPSAHVWINLLEFRLAQPLLPAAMWGLECEAKNAVVSLVAREMRHKIDDLRKRLGLQPERNFFRTWLYRQELNIGLFPAWFVPWFHGQLPNTVLTDFPLYQGRSTGVPADDLENFLARGEPPIVFTNASWRRGLDEYFEASVAACEALGLRGVLLSAAATEFAHKSDSVIAVGFTPLQALLPRSAAIVHHAGLGTMAAAMAAGIPQIALPYVYDHPHNAGYLQRFGVGAKLSTKDYKRDVTATLKRLLESDGTRENCRKVAARFEGGPDFSEAISRLESLLERSRQRTTVSA